MGENMEESQAPRKNGRYKRQELTPKQAQFCTNYFLYSTIQEAAKQAGLNPRTASTMIKLPLVKARIDKMREKIFNDDVMEVMERKSILSSIARAQVTDYIGEDGEVKVDRESRNKSAISKYSIRYHKDGKKEKVVETRNPIEAIKVLNEMDGVNGNPNVSVGIVFKVVYDDTAKRIEGTLADPSPSPEGVYLLGGETPDNQGR